MRRKGMLKTTEPKKLNLFAKLIDTSLWKISSIPKPQALILYRSVLTHSEKKEILDLDAIFYLGIITEM
jgi:hypothetical protein